MAFDWKGWTEKFKTNPGYNDATEYGVIVSELENPLYDVIGIHLLTDDENVSGKSEIYLDVLCKPEQDGGPKRIMNAVVNWTWEGRIESGLPNPVLIGKPENEIATLTIFPAMKINVWSVSGNGVTNLKYPHSFLVVFQEIGSGVIVPPAPPPVEDKSVLRIEKSWLDEQQVDEDGYIRIYNG